MKTRLFFNGHIIISTKLYNFLYILLCVVVLVCVIISFAELNYSLLGDIDCSFEYAVSLLIRGCLTSFIGYKLLNKNNYS